MNLLGYANCSAAAAANFYKLELCDELLGYAICSAVETAISSSAAVAAISVAAIRATAPRLNSGNSYSSYGNS